jgi:hypothetical protein
MIERDDTSRHSRDPVAEYFAKRGVSAGVRRKGLRGIIAEWHAIAHTAPTYDLTLDDWLNDVDLRDIIAGAFAVAPETVQHDLRKFLDQADDDFRAATIECSSLRGTSKDEDTRDRTRAWWYYRCPARPGETMRRDLAAAGIQPAS